jgi:hypothetical protein
MRGVASPDLKKAIGAGVCERHPLRLSGEQTTKPLAAELTRGGSSHLNPEVTMPGKRVQFDDETWLALDVLARDRMMSFQELADEAFRDLLKKQHRPINLKSA